MRKELLIVPPHIDTYPNLNTVLSIAMAHEEAKHWFYNKFVIIYGTMSRRFNFHGHFIDGWTMQAMCPFVRRNAYTHEYIDTNYTSFMEFVIHCIDSGHYVYATLDRFYNERAEDDYQKYHYVHQMFIYGYDTEQKVVLGADFYDGNYLYREVSFEGIEKGYHGFEQVTNLPGGAKSEVVTFSYKPGKWQFDLVRLIESLEDYLKGVDSSNLFYYVVTRQEQQDFKYGIRYYETLRQLVQEKDWDRRAFHILYEHKKIMVERLEYLKDHIGYENEAIEKAYRELQDEAMIVRNLVLKNLFQEQAGRSERLKELLDKMERSEREAVTELVAGLRELAQVQEL